MSDDAVRDDVVYQALQRRIGQAVLRQRGKCETCGASMRYVLCGACGGDGWVADDQAAGEDVECLVCACEGGWYTHDCPAIAKEDA